MSKTSNTKRVSREEGAQRKVWQAPAKLEVPDAPDGEKYRWVRHTLQGESQDSNVYERTRQHYELVKADELDNFGTDTMEGGKYDGVVRSGDLILMRVPDYIADQRTKHYEDLSKRQQQAVDMEVTGLGTDTQPVSIESKTKVSGSQAQFQD